MIKKYIAQASLMKKISDILFVSALITSLYTLISTYMVRSQLPSGVCPIDDNSNMFYISIGLLLLAFLFSFFNSKK